MPPRAPQQRGSMSRRGQTTARRSKQANPRIRTVAPAPDETQPSASAPRSRLLSVEEQEHTIGVLDFDSGNAGSGDDRLAAREHAGTQLLKGIEVEEGRGGARPPRLPPRRLAGHTVHDRLEGPALLLLGGDREELTGESLDAAKRSDTAWRNSTARPPTTPPCSSSGRCWTASSSPAATPTRPSHADRHRPHTLLIQTAAREDPRSGRTHPPPAAAPRLPAVDPRGICGGLRLARRSIESVPQRTAPVDPSRQRGRRAARAHPGERPGSAADGCHRRAMSPCLVLSGGLRLASHAISWSCTS